MRLFLLFYSRLRQEERMLIDAAREVGVELKALNARSCAFLEEGIWHRGELIPFGAVSWALARCVSHHQNLEVSTALGLRGVRVVNPPEVIGLCGDKFATSCRLSQAGIPQPRYGLAFSEEGAMEVAERIGYPLVVKPVMGSWGRMVSLVEDEEALSSLLEYKERLGPQHQIIYLQEYVEKGGFDIRAFTLGGQFLCAIKRRSPHWITNTARGGKAEAAEVTDDLVEICERTARAIGGFFLAMDVFKTADGRLLVNEVNDTAEFRNSVAPTGVDIPKHLLLKLQETSG